MKNIRIKEVAIYHPENNVHNDYYIDYFKEKGKNPSKLMEVLGRKERFIVNDEEENSLSMGIKASMKALEQGNISAEDIDLLVFTTQTPETSIPTNALRLHEALKCSSKTTVFDLNANCAGMTLALDFVGTYMKSHSRIQRALIIGSDYFSLISDSEDEMGYTCFGDAAAAILLEQTTDDVGLIDSNYYIDTIYSEQMMFPAEGFNKGVRETGDLNTLKILPIDGSTVLLPTYNMIQGLLDKHNLEPKQIKYCFSQFAISNILKIQEHFQLEDEQIIYVGDQFGYTGTSSPIIAFHEGIKNGQINRDDYVLFWTVGTGFQLVATLFKY